MDSSEITSIEGLIVVVEMVERQLIIKALTTKGNITQAAKDLLGTESMLGIRVKKYNIESWRYKV